MSNHRETTTGTAVHGKMGCGARRKWWVRKRRAKSTRGRGGPSGQRSRFRGGWGQHRHLDKHWGGNGSVLPVSPSIHSPESHGAAGNYEIKRHIILLETGPPDHHSRDKGNVKGGKFSTPPCGPRLAHICLLCPFL